MSTKAATCTHSDPKQWRRVPSRKYRYLTSVFCRLCGKWVGYERSDKRDREAKQCYKKH